MPDLFPDRGEIRFRKARDAGGVLNATFALLRRNARELLVGYIALVAPVALAAGVAMALWISSIGPLFLDPQAIEQDPMAVMGAGYLGFVAFALLSSAVGHAAIAAYVRLYRQGEAGTITAGALWDEGRGFILPLIGMALLFSVMTMVAQLLGFVPLLGGLLYLGLLIWIYPYYIVATVARTIDAPSIAAAVQRAQVLVKGSWGGTAGALVLALLVVAGLFFAVMLVGSFVTAFIIAGVGAGDPARIITVVGLVFAPVVVLSALFYTIPLLTGYFVHGRLTEELEGTTLYEDLDTLEDAALDRAPGGTRVPWPLAPEPDEDAADVPPAEPDRDDPPRDDRDDTSSTSSGGFRGGGFGDA